MPVPTPTPTPFSPSKTSSSPALISQQEASIDSLSSSITQTTQTQTSFSTTTPYTPYPTPTPFPTPTPISTSTLTSFPTLTPTHAALLSAIPGGVNSPVRSFKGLGIPPMIVESGRGDQIVDIGGNSFIDYCLSWGPLIHGHAHPVIVQAIQQRMEKGFTFGITTAAEERLASLIVEWIDSIEKIRFVSSGTEATMSAVRLARGYTGRKTVVKFNGNYHGHADLFLVKAGSGVTTLSASSSAGIPDESVQHVVSLPYNDLQAARTLLQSQKVACVILEPIAANIGVVPATIEFLEMLRKETKKQGALLIFDEVITGFRVGLQGAQGLYGITPDLSCFGKVMGGGLPAAAFGGKGEIMDYLAPLGPVYQAGTLSGNPLTMEAGWQTLQLLKEPGFFEELERKTNVITQPIKELIEQKGINACVQQVGSLFTLFFGRREVRNHEEALQLDLETFAHFFRYMYQHGVYIPPSQHETWCLSSVHQEKHLEYTRDLILQYFYDQA